jgi:hypothetical protein
MHQSVLQAPAVAAVDPVVFQAEDHDPEVTAAVNAVIEAAKARKQTIDVGPELMASLYAYVKDNNVRPQIVKSKSQAKRMTAKDPDGYRWKMGERYFIVVAAKGAPT